MKTNAKRFPWLRSFGCFLAAVWIADTATSQTYVSPDASIMPGLGDEATPFQLVRTATHVHSSQQIAGDVILAPGTYPESITLDEPMTLRKGTGAGSAAIGRFGLLDQETTLSIYTMNTHFFGDGSPGGFACPPCLPTAGESIAGSVLEPQVRATALVTYLTSIEDGVDIVCLQEVWNELALLTLQPLLDIWPHTYYGGAIEGGGCLNSGLYILSKYPLSDESQVFYEVEEPGGPFGEDGASKGWVQCTVTKGGFELGLFTTHTDAEAADFAIRTAQLAQLRGAVDVYKAANPERPVFLAGDFNIAQDSTDCSVSNCWEYHTTLGGLFGDIFRDVHPQVESWWDEPISLRLTATGTNDLYDLFTPTAQWERLDYILYEPGSPTADYAVVPLSAFVDFDGEPWTGVYNNSSIGLPCIPLGAISTSDLSDHQAVFALFSILHP